MIMPFLYGITIKFGKIKLKYIQKIIKIFIYFHYIKSYKFLKSLNFYTVLIIDVWFLGDFWYIIEK